MQHLTGNFILTVTRVSPEKEFSKKSPNKIIVKRKVPKTNKNSSAIYEFNSFDDFCDFCTYIFKNIPKIKNSFKNSCLYLYNSKYYLILDNILLDLKTLKQFCFILTEFSTYISNANLFERKLSEYGKKIINKNAISTCIKYFI